MTLIKKEDMQVDLKPQCSRCQQYRSITVTTDGGGKWKRLEHLDNTVYHVYFVDGKTEEFTAMDHHLINVKLRR